MLENEIYQAVNQTGALKAPGPDGIHAIFYQTYWNQIKHLVIDFVQDFFRNNSSLTKLNETNNIVLIPKTDAAESVNHYRPISLCNVSYKIISKIIVNRLKPLLNKCISNTQGAFAPGRSIYDNILIAHELFSSFARKK